MARTNRGHEGLEAVNFESLVQRYYTGLYQFALSLSHSQADACDLTQQTFYLWGYKGYQVRDPAKVKTWLFTTLYREFLKTQRRQQRFPHVALSEVDSELPTVPAHAVEQLDWRILWQCFAQIEERYRAPLVLFYLGDHSYVEIAEILAVPIGTVMSRLSRGRQKLQALLVTTRSPEMVSPARR
jgi:RNA polymerase sigma-70 factor (ECF subfamily)